MADIHDYDIQQIEDEILMKYNDSRYDYEDFDCLLEMRKRMINNRVLAHQEDILSDIIAFNDALTAALREMYDRHIGYGMTLRIMTPMAMMWS